MLLPDLVSHQRLSVNSCATDDSIESSAIATPRDASPRHHQQSNRFSIIKIVNNDPHPEVSSIPAVAPRRRAQTLPESTQALTIVKPQPMPIAPATTHKSGSKLRKLWPRIKRIMMSSKTNIIPQESSKMKQLLETMHIAEKKTADVPTKEHRIKNWLERSEGILRTGTHNTIKSFYIFYV
ncbi:hypothetical protein K501DRAFT_330113 [Backusella circina FSU 941]|nr:hypothetical protein K501DRAFT_330113 [Backusella circina FSU 941]